MRNWILCPSLKNKQARRKRTRKRKLHEIHILSLKVVCLILMKSIGYAADYYTQGVNQLFTCDLASCV